MSPVRARFAPLLAAPLCVLPGCGHHGSGAGAPPPPGQPLTVDFALRRDLHLGSAFLGDLLHVDLDRDGVEDLVEANFGTDFVTLAQGHLDGTFTTLFELPTLGHAFRLAAGDFDGDGHLDVAVACGDWVDGAQRGVQVFLQGPGDFEFGAPLSFELDTDPKDLCAAPQSGRAGGGPDELFVALRDDRRVLRLALAGGALVENGALESANIGAGAPFSLAALDLGGDGWIDLAVGEDNPGIDRVIAYPRTAAGFQPATLVLEPVARPVVDATGDMDGNGFEDLAVAQLEAEDVFLLAGDAAGLSRVSALDFGGATTSLLFRDLDGDGLAEAVATVFLQQSVQVKRALAPFVWDDSVHYNVGLAPRAIGVLALPGDGVPDLLCANAQDLSLLVGTGGGAFRGARGVPLGAAPTALATGDLDGDGDADAAVLTRAMTLVLLENRVGALAPWRVLDLGPAPLGEPGDLALGDLDGDGDADLVVSLSESDELRIFRNDGGRFGEPEILGAGPRPMGVALGDFDRDGRTDIAVANAGARTIGLWHGAAGGFAELPAVGLPAEPLDLLCADLDLDGRPELAATARLASGQHALLVLAGKSAAFELVHSLSISDAAGTLALGDLDEDGRPDLVLGQPDLATDELVLLRNEGKLAFSEQTLALSSGPGTPLVADVDEDGHPDLVVLTTEGELALVLGDGSGQMRAPPRARGALSSPEGTLAAALADIDGDRLPELLMISPQAPFVWVAHNTSVERAVE